MCIPSLSNIDIQCFLNPNYPLVLENQYYELEMLSSLENSWIHWPGKPLICVNISSTRSFGDK